MPVLNGRVQSRHQSVYPEWRLQSRWRPPLKSSVQWLDTADETWQLAGLIAPNPRAANRASIYRVPVHELPPPNHKLPAPVAASVAHADKSAHPGKSIAPHVYAQLHLYETAQCPTHFPAPEWPC